MLTSAQLSELLPLAAEWVLEQESNILKKGIELSDDQQIDAYLIGVKEITKVRLLKVSVVPFPEHELVRNAAFKAGFLTPATIGLTCRHGIFIKEDHWKERRLIIHELTHTHQYERFGSIEKFLSQYLHECLTQGYANSPLEFEARYNEIKISGM